MDAGNVAGLYWEMQNSLYRDGRGILSEFRDLIEVRLKSARCASSAFGAHNARCARAPRKNEPAHKFSPTCAAHAMSKRWYWRVWTSESATGWTAELHRIRTTYSPGGTIREKVEKRVELKSLITGETLRAYTSEARAWQAMLRFHGARLAPGHIVLAPGGVWLIKN